MPNFVPSWNGSEHSALKDFLTGIRKKYQFYRLVPHLKDFAITVKLGTNIEGTVTNEKIIHNSFTSCVNHRLRS